LKCGYFFSNFFVPFSSSGYSLKCLSFVVVSKEYGAIIFDTGSPFKPEEVLNQLKDYFDLFPEDIKWVFTTHCHPDHVGANGFFKRAKFIFSKRDFDFAEEVAEVALSEKSLLNFLFDRCPGYVENFDETEERNIKYYVKNFWSRENLGLNYSRSFMEDNPEIPEFIKPFETFGHTHFHYSFNLISSVNNFFVTGDSVSNRLILKNELKERLLEPHMDFENYFKTVDFFKKQSGIVIPGHDRPFNISDSIPIKTKIFEI